MLAKKHLIPILIIASSMVYTDPGSGESPTPTAPHPKKTALTRFCSYVLTEVLAMMERSRAREEAAWKQTKLLAATSFAGVTGFFSHLFGMDYDDSAVRAGVKTIRTVPVTYDSTTKRWTATEGNIAQLKQLKLEELTQLEVQERQGMSIGGAEAQKLTRRIASQKKRVETKGKDAEHELCEDLFQGDPEYAGVRKRTMNARAMKSFLAAAVTGLMTYGLLSTIRGPTGPVLA